MNPVSSISALCRAARHDMQLSRIGTTPGWYLRTFYRGRLDSRLGRSANSRVASTNVEVFDRKLNLFLSAPQLSAFRGIFVEQEYDVRAHLPSVLERPRILDLGANVGFAAAYMSALFPECEMICCEPDPRNLPLLERTIQSNELNATIRPQAIASKAGKLQLRIGENSTCSVLESSPMHDHQNSVEVSVATIPEVMQSAGWDRIDLLKIDIEGTEQDLLGNDNSWLAKVDAIVMEIHPNTSEEEIGGFLEPHGLKLKRIGFGYEPVYFASRESQEQ